MAPPILVSSLRIRKLIIASIILITVPSGHSDLSTRSTLTPGIGANDPLHDNVSQDDEARKNDYRSTESSNYVGRHSSTLNDDNTNFIAYKDTKWKNCYLEKMQKTSHQLAETSKGPQKSHSSGPRTLYGSINSLTKLEAWRLAGGKIVDFCSGMTISLLEETRPVPNWTDDPFYNELPEDENDIIQIRAMESLLTPLLERIKRKTLLENRKALDSKGQEKWGMSQGQRRTRRQAPPSPYQGRFRGQTQSQYLNVDGDSQKAGRAEAEATHESSHAIVSGNSGMGQAQSMSAGGLGCEGCPLASRGGEALYPGAAIQSSTKDLIPKGGGYVTTGPSFTQVGSQGYPGLVGPSPDLGTRPFTQTLEPRKSWNSPGDTRFSTSTSGVSGTPGSGSGTGSGTGTGSGIESDLYPHSSGGKVPFPYLYRTPGNNGIQPSGGNIPGAGLYPDTSLVGRGQPGSDSINGSPIPGSVPSQTFYPSSPGKDTTGPNISGPVQGGTTNLPGAVSATRTGPEIKGTSAGIDPHGTPPESQFYPGSSGDNTNSGGSYPARIPSASGPGESTFYPGTQGGTRVSGNVYPAYYPGGTLSPSERHFDGRLHGTNVDVQNNRNAGVYPGISNEGPGHTYGNAPYWSPEGRGSYPGSSYDSTSGRDVYSGQPPPFSGPSVSSKSYPINKYGGPVTGSKIYTGVGNDGADRGPVYPGHSVPAEYTRISGYPGDVNSQTPLTTQGKPAISATRETDRVEGTGGTAEISDGRMDGTRLYGPSLDEIAPTRFPYSHSPAKQGPMYFGESGGAGSDGAGVATPGAVGITSHEGTAGGRIFYPGPQSGVSIPTEGRSAVLYPDGTMPGIGQPGLIPQGRYDGHDSRGTFDGDRYYNRPSSSWPVYPHANVDPNNGATSIFGGSQNYPVNVQEYPTNVPGIGGRGGPMGVGQQYPNGVGVGPGGVRPLDTTGVADNRYRDRNASGLPPSGLQPNQPSIYYSGSVGSNRATGLPDSPSIYGLVPEGGYGTNGGPGSIGDVGGTGGATDISADGKTLGAGSNVEADANADSHASSSVKQGEKGGTQASASAQGTYGGGTAQSQVSGTYSGSGSFSAQAGTSDASKSAQSQVNGGKEGAASNAQGVGGRGKSQSQVQLDSESGATSTGAQSNGWNHGTNSQVQASSKGGMADAQANGEGSTSSQAQIGFQPYLNRNSNFNDGHEKHGQERPFRGGGTASAQSGTYRGQSQSQIQGSFLYGISYTGAAQAGSGSGAAASRKPFNFSTTDQPLFKKFESYDALSASAPERNSSPRDDDLNVNYKFEDIPIVMQQETQNQSVSNTKLFSERGGPDTDALQTSSSQRKTVTVPLTTEKQEKSTVLPSSSIDAAYEAGNMTDDYEYEDEEDYDSSATPNAPREESPPTVQHHDLIPSNIRNVDGDKFDYDAKHEANSNDQLARNEKLNGSKESTNHRYSIHVPQDPLTAIPRAGDVLESGQSLPGYTVPPGFRGRIASLPEPAKASDTHNSHSRPALNPSESHGIHDASPALQTRSSHTHRYRERNPTTQRKYFSHPSGFGENRMQRQPSHSVPNTYLRANFASNPNSDADLDTGPSYGRPPRPNYYTVTNSVAGKMDDSNGSRNAGRKYEHRYYTKSSTCGYFTFSCNIVHGSNGRTKICKPKVPTNPDGSPMKC
ncbi:uncharacterized protein LOC107273476 [Cephus cinctus]|uniref:Uncharacterized protein LOC107273476 n=1 Tax=Cephus cinctus TaxID=211228 RepID=A0AAJ7FTA3_CEPCN|nr:uncharacterized protein LOC107273476 [Cephus cinctus]